MFDDAVAVATAAVAAVQTASLALRIATSPEIWDWEE